MGFAKHDSKQLLVRDEAVEYMRHTTNYQQGVEALYAAATDKNLDAATEAYAKIAKNCIECHRIVRLEPHKQSILEANK